MKSKLANCRQIVRAKDQLGVYHWVHLHESLWINICKFCGKDSIKKVEVRQDGERMAVRACPKCKAIVEGKNLSLTQAQDLVRKN